MSKTATRAGALAGALLPCAALLWTATGGPALAQAPASKEAPYLEGSIGGQFRTDAISRDSFGRNVDGKMYLDEVEASFGLHLTEWLGFHATIKGEALRTQRPNTSRAFHGFGLFVEELYADVEPVEWLRLFGGKFNPTFGVAWRDSPLVYRKDFAKDYETTEQIGFGAQFTGDFGAAGKHTLTAQLFFADTSFLHTSAITRPKIGQASTSRVSNARRSDGGPGNTGEFDNASVTLEGGGFGWLPDLSYNLGYRRLDKGVTETKVEHGFAAALEYAWTTEALLPGKTTLKPLYEIAWFRNAGGQPGKATYNTPGLTLEWGDWIVGVSATWRSFYDAPGLADVNDALYTGAVEYKLDEVWRIGAGYKRARAGGAVDHTIGFKIQAGYDFLLGLGR